MAISSEYIALLRLGIDSSPEWKEAWERINDYLDALKTPDSVDRELILLTSFERAIVRKRRQPDVPATALVFEETQKTLDEALQHLINEGVSEDRRSVEQRIRLYLTENVDGNLLGRTEELTEEVRQALREVRLQPAPNLQLASIVARPLEFSGPGKRLISLAERLSPLGANRILGWVICLAILGALVVTSLYR
ncbi:MAG TPA: hypothetical protein VE860_26235 [Chthoniobacterales bacterium]|nr:hypothetical protein [Chthoniobacterales bacterium]